MTIDLESMTIDELYLLHQEVTAILVRMAIAKKNELEARLQQLQLPDDRELPQSKRAGPIAR